IYIPMYTEGRWHLMVVDMRNQLLIYLYSFKDDKLYDQKVGQMQFVALFLHTMLRGRRFYQKKTSIPAMIKDFKLTEHVTGQQGEYS
ncbi:hypothetical protein HN873_047896, partial [Arachis hypogaea]